MDNHEEYVVLCADTRITEGTPEISIEAQNVCIQKCSPHHQRNQGSSENP